MEFRLALFVLFQRVTHILVQSFFLDVDAGLGCVVSAFPLCVLRFNFSESVSKCSKFFDFRSKHGLLCVYLLVYLLN